MSKKFILKWRDHNHKIVTATVVCDDQDAYLFRSYAYIVDAIGTNRACVARYLSSATIHQKRQFSFDILGKPPVGFLHTHIDGNPLNLRRSNYRTVSEADHMRMSILKRKMSSHANV